MRLRCHAILKSGAMCRAASHSVVDGSPVCDRQKHSEGLCEFMPMTTGTVYPNHLEPALIVTAFRGGSSIAQIAQQFKQSVRFAENVIRNA